MKRKILYLLLIVFALFFIACKEKIETKTDQEIVDEFINTITLPETLTESLNLQNVYSNEGNEFYATWESSNKRILTNDGKYYLSKNSDIITLTLTLKYKDVSSEKTFELYVSESPINSILMAAYNELDIKKELSSDLVIPSTFKYSTYTIEASIVSSDEDIINNNGEIALLKEDKEVSLDIILKMGDTASTITEKFTVLKVDESKVSNILKDLGYDNSYEENLNLPNKIYYNNKEIFVTWSSNNPNVLSNAGIINPQSNDTNVSLTASTEYGSYTYNVIVKPLSDATCIQNALSYINIPNLITSDILLDTELNYGVKAEWVSSDESILSNDGKLTSNQAYKNITLTLKLSKGDETYMKEYNVSAGKQDHLFLDRTFEGEKENVCIQNGKLVLESGATLGSYTTKEISTLDYDECVGSFAAITSKNATCELMVRLYSNGKWSKYFTYGTWGRALQNVCPTGQSDTYVKMVEDEILLKDNNVANKFQLKITLRRDNASYSSPIVSLIALSLRFKSYTYNVDIKDLAKDVHPDVPKLNQGVVPEIGGSICSATTSTMLLKNKGHSFANLSEEDYELDPKFSKSQTSYEHGYIAYIVRDYGNNIFGNWVYNCIGISSYGEISYVKRMYSNEELMYHLATVGPVGCSIKGSVVNGVKNYTTGGHLIVVTGYRINDDGSRIFYINDPNVPSVSVEMTEDALNNVNRGVYYIVE